APSPAVCRGAGGKTRPFVNDQPVSIGLLRRIGAVLVEIHGQHDERAFVERSAHRALLDAFGGLDREVKAVTAAYASWREAEDRAARLRSEVASAEAECAYLRASVI